MATLAGLPDELLLQICEHLSITDEFMSGYDGAAILGNMTRKEGRALSRLCRLSKRLQPFAQRALYKNIPQMSPENRYCLLRTFVECPDLARLVRAMNMGDCNITSSELISLFDAARPRLKISERLAEIVTADAVEETDGFDYAFVLLLLPNLEQLEIEARYDVDYEMCNFVKEIRAGADGNPVALARLRELRIRHGDESGATTLRQRGLLTLPTLRVLRGWSVQWEGSSLHDRVDGYLKTPFERLSLEHIDFTWSFCNDNSFSNMMSRCPDLKILSIEWDSSTLDYGHDQESADMGDDFTGMGDELRKYGSKLEHLTLDICYESGDVQGDGRIGSLCDLLNLKYIALSHEVLVGRDDDSGEYEDEDEDDSNGSKRRLLQLSDVLPANLEELHLHSFECDEGHLDDQLYQVIAGTKFTNLRKVTVRGRESDIAFRHDLSEHGWVAGQTWNLVILCKKAEYGPMTKAVEDWSLRRSQFRDDGVADVSDSEET